MSQVIRKSQSISGSRSAEEFSDLMLWETIERSRINRDSSRQGKFIIGVFTGGLRGVQVDQFQEAIKTVIQEFELYYNPGKLQISIFCISAKDVANQRMTPTELINRLLDSDVHFILSHIHQSLLERNIGWRIDDLMSNLERLKYHKGFPSGEQLSCPVFTQDKYDYISRIAGYSIPTMKVPIIGSNNYPDNFKEKVTRWCSENDDGCGWVVKSPFTTNSQFIRFPKSVEEVFNLCIKAYEDPKIGFGQIPYLMIQPCVFNRKEYKVIVLNSDPFYISAVDSRNSKKSANGIHKAFSSSPHDELVNFCKESLTMLTSNCPYAIVDGLFRIDVMQMRSGRFVVNEFESLEANYYGKMESQEFVVSMFLKNYWKAKIRFVFNNTLKILSENHFNETIAIIGIGNMTFQYLK